MNPYFPESIQLQNREAFQRDRDKYLQTALGKVVYLLNNVRIIHTKNNNSEKLLGIAEELVSDLKEARYYGFRGLGGDATNPPNFISAQEIAAIDHIGIMYHTAQGIIRFLRHQCRVRDYQQKHQIKDRKSLKYIRKLIENDQQVILNDLETMKERMDLYNSFVNSQLPTDN